ncbi:MAG TPA: HlyD family secretion protein, partial [Gemmatimonadales bacterium]|nr:HlyD family secretion protein [Gemmatimonadales bacterium]
MATTIEPEVRRESAAKAAPPGPPAPAPAAPKAGGRRGTAFMVMGLVLLALVALGARRWIYGLSHVSTDNAQVDGHIVPILPKVGGFVTDVRIDENQNVKAGDTLVVLDDRDYKVRLAQAEADLAVALAGVSNRARVGQAEAQVEQAQANALKAHADLERVRPLALQEIVSKQQLDAVEAAARAADAALAAAQASLLAADARVGASRAARDQAALNLSYTRVIAPSSGVVSKKTVELGQLVQAGQPLMSVVPLEDVWLTANLKETEVADVKPGEPVDFTVDAYPGAHFTGHVQSLSPATGARFSLLPPDNATGNFTKVVQRVPVRVRPDKVDP